MSSRGDKKEELQDLSEKVVTTLVGGGGTVERADEDGNREVEVEPTPGEVKPHASDTRRHYASRLLTSHVIHLVAVNYATRINRLKELAWDDSAMEDLKQPSLE
ncbi:hypothetical protein Y032_0131g1671 [Ancylostoma ceylanicum]|nr:hypothetical protein Y032_0131g1671 [Ancylostoma ceylanicum]